MKKEIMPWRKRRKGGKLLPQRRGEENPFMALHREMNELFEDFFGDFETGLAWPRSSGLRSRDDAGTIRIDVAENEKEFRVMADVPGLEEQDIDVELSDNLLTIRAEKTEERDEQEADFHIVERSYGSFQRTVPLPGGLEQDQAQANFKNGVLTIIVPKSAEARQSRRQIPVQAG